MSAERFSGYRDMIWRARSRVASDQCVIAGEIREFGSS
jgi:hypothetical protein